MEIIATQFKILFCKKSVAFLLSTGIITWIFRVEKNLHLSKMKWQLCERNPAFHRDSFNENKILDCSWFGKQSACCSVFLKFREAQRKRTDQRFLRRRRKTSPHFPLTLSHLWSLNSRVIFSTRPQLWLHVSVQSWTNYRSWQHGLFFILQPFGFSLSWRPFQNQELVSDQSCALWSLHVPDSEPEVKSEPLTLLGVSVTDDPG